MGYLEHSSGQGYDVVLPIHFSLIGCTGSMVAGDCNVPNALMLPFRLELSATC